MDDFQRLFSYHEICSTCFKISFVFYEICSIRNEICTFIRYIRIVTNRVGPPPWFSKLVFLFLGAQISMGNEEAEDAATVYNATKLSREHTHAERLTRQRS